MATTVLNLINNAFYVSGIVARDFQTVSGQQIGTGLECLNEILTDKRVEDDMIPYYTKYDFNAVVGQEMYFIPGCIKFDTLVFFLDSIRYAISPSTRIKYQGSSRANDINSFPVIYYVERCLGGANLFMYFWPDQAYAFEGWGLFDMSTVAINQDMELTLDPFYISYLKYALADRLCTNYNYEVPAKVEKQLAWYQTNISNRSQEMDLSMTKLSTLDSSNVFNYAQVNIGRGFVPGY